MITKRVDTAFNKAFTQRSKIRKDSLDLEECKHHIKSKTVTNSAAKVSVLVG